MAQSCYGGVIEACAEPRHATSERQTSMWLSRATDSRLALGRFAIGPRSRGRLATEAIYMASRSVTPSFAEQRRQGEKERRGKGGGEEK